MRVISGEAKGIRLVSPAGSETRPTLDRHKESLFNIINPYLINSRFLDLFSGSGAIGIEALSRGASFCCFVDQNKESVDCIKQNLNHTRLNHKAQVYHQEIINALDQLKSNNLCFDIVYMDPPYDLIIIPTVLGLLKEYGLLGKQGFVIAEHSSNYTLEGESDFIVYRVKKYGRTAMSYLEMSENE